MAIGHHIQEMFCYLARLSSTNSKACLHLCSVSRKKQQHKISGYHIKALRHIYDVSLTTTLPKSSEAPWSDHDKIIAMHCCTKHQTQTSTSHSAFRTVYSKSTQNAQEIWPYNTNPLWTPLFESQISYSVHVAILTQKAVTLNKPTYLAELS